ncbi:MAG: hypothetical protein IPP74_05225 [Alphaproteobacteria bacterium]|nr:hypothetical protein [Alphaproteobacteria bacterium]
MREIIKEIIVLEDRELAYFQLVSLFRNSSADERDYIINQWDFGVKWKYPNQRRLCCLKGERFTCKDRIEASLSYFAISARKSKDIRESIFAYAVIYNSCTLIGLDPVRIFHSISEIADPNIKQSMNDFILRKDENKSLSAFKLTTKQNEHGEIELVTMWDTKSSNA